MCDKSGALHTVEHTHTHILDCTVSSKQWTAYAHDPLEFISFHLNASLHCLHTNNWTFAYSSRRDSGWNEWNIIRDSLSEWQHNKPLILKYVLDLHGSISMSSDTLYSYCPFIKSSIVYFAYRPLMCCGPISSDPFTMCALMLGTVDCIKCNAIEMTKNDRGTTGRGCEHILPIIILIFVWLFMNGTGINHRNTRTRTINI